MTWFGWVLGVLMGISTIRDMARSESDEAGALTLVVGTLLTIGIFVIGTGHL